MGCVVTVEGSQQQFFMEERVEIPTVRWVGVSFLLGWETVQNGPGLLKEFLGIQRALLEVHGEKREDLHLWN